MRSAPALLPDLPIIAQTSVERRWNLPSTPPPIVGNLGPVWTPVFQSLQIGKQKAGHLAAAKQQGAVFDQWFNTVELSGSNLDQVVTIGAAFLQGGVEVATGVANGTAGRIVQANLAIGTLTVTKNSTAATLVGTASGTFASGQQIGAITAADVDVLTPGTTFTRSGSSITLSLIALASGTALYCAACNWTLV